MTKETAEELCQLIMANAEGKTIQYQYEYGWKDDVFTEATIELALQRVSLGKYCIKPEPKYVPLKDLSVLKGKFLLTKGTQIVRLVTGYNKELNKIEFSEAGWWTNDEIFERKTYEDGSVIGEPE